MDKQEQVEQLTNYVAHFVAHTAKVLPDDVIAKLDELAEKEDSPLSKTIYQTMKLNQKLAKDLNRPSCQDTGVMQFVVRCGTNFPLINELEVLLKEAVIRATQQAPLRHNSVETFDEYNTGKNARSDEPIKKSRKSLSRDISRKRSPNCIYNSKYSTDRPTI